MKKFILTAAAALYIGIGWASTEATGTGPLWMRNVAISPDGKRIAFTYKGDIFTVSSEGGRAVRMTADKKYDTAPIWSPDGRTIAFSSDREGSLDIFTMPSAGGTPVRLTTMAGTETPLFWKNNETIVFSATSQPSRKSVQAPIFGQTYEVSVKGGSPRMVYSMPMMKGDADANGRILYQDKKGYENAWRKHERSSGTADIWLIDNDKFTRLTDFNGSDMNPVWGAGDTYYFLNDSDGTLNVYQGKLGEKAAGQLTSFKDNPVRFLSASKNGEILAFGQDGEIYTMKRGDSPRKLNISIVTDEYDSDEVKGIRTTGEDNMAVSPDGSQIAFSLRGDIYVTSDKYKTTKRITNTPGQERVVAFSPDGRSLVYDSERDGVWQIYQATIKNPNEKKFPYATEIEEKQLVNDGITSQQPAYSPDGKKIAYLQNRTQLVVMDLATGTKTTALDGKYNYSYSDGDIEFEWSPDSKWLLASYIGVGGWNNRDVALVKADGTEVIDLTESGYTDSNPHWILDGKGISYDTSRYGYRSHGSWGEQSDVVAMMLDPEGWDKLTLTEEEADLEDVAEKDAKSKANKEKTDNNKKNKKKGDKDKRADVKKEKNIAENFDLENRKYRMKRLTPGSGFIGNHLVSPKGDKLYYSARTSEGKWNLMERDLRKGDVKVLAPGVGGAIVADSAVKNLYVLANGITKVSLPDGKTEKVEYEAEFDRKPSLEREYIYDHVARQVKDKFYDVNYHGVDWDAYCKHYRKFLPYISNGYDFAELLSELLGELNASHTGGRYYGSSGNPTANLGAFFDQDYTGPGLKVDEVIARGPLSPKKVGIRPGDIIIAIDGKTIEAGADYNPMLEGKIGRKVRLTVRKTDGQSKDVIVKPMSNGQVSDLLLTRWVKRNQEIVDSLSGGRIAYVHIKGMDSPSFRTVYDELLGKYRNREAVIVDTRYNGGGWLHNDVALLLSGKEYVRFSPRGQYIGSEPFSQWTKPSVMLINESNYSDAHGTPYVYKTLGLGELIGAPVPGTMTAVWWETQIDPDIVFGIPQVTSLDMNGKALENQQLNPDIEVYNSPEDVMNGHDSQLQTAVEHLLKKLQK